MEPQSREFKEWFFGKSGIYRLAIFVGMVSTASYSAWLSLKDWYFDTKPNLDELLGILAFVQVVLLFVFTVVPIHTKRFSEKTATTAAQRKIRDYCGCNGASWVDAQKRANKAVEQFESNFHLLLIIWLLLYAALSIKHLLLPTKNHLWINFSIVMLGVLAAAIQFSLFTILAKVTTNGKGYKSAKTKILLFVGVFAVMYLGVIAFYQGPTADQFFLNKNVLLNLPVWLSGILSGMSFALVIGRLDSKYINSPTKVLFLLYMYAAMQPLFGVLLGGGYLAISLAIIILTMFLKAVLYIYVVWMLEKGRLVFYFGRVRRLHDNVEKEIGHLQTAKVLE